MKKPVLLLLGMFFLAATNAQSQTYPPLNEKCATTHSLNYRSQQSALVQSRIQQAEANASQWLQQNGGQSLRNGVVTIPVVVHLVHNPGTPESNIPDSLIHSQIAVLNQDFRRLNLDASNTRAIFDTVAGDLGIEFCLATVDPNGNPTTGINRVSSTSSHMLTPFNNSVKSSSTGGADPWPSTDYLNLWICDMSFFGTPAVLGYAQFPGDDPATDGVVLQYQFVGVTNDPATAPANKGRTATHEVGHWLGLRHIWGDGDCSMDDFVWDTPNADAQSNSDCNHNSNTCDDLGNPFWGISNPPDMVENFMDYSADSCMNMFSKGQGDRIWSFLSTERIGLFSSNGCGTPTVNAYSTLTHESCVGACTGIAVVTPVAGQAPFTFLWDDPSAQTDSIAENLCAGLYHCKIKDANNDSILVAITIYNPNPLLVVSANTVSATCASCADGSIAVGAVGGTAPVLYTLDGGAAQTDSVFNGLNPGTYTVQVIDGCGLDSTFTLSVGNSVGIDAIAFESAFSLYPNPADERISLTFGNNKSMKKIEIMDPLGKIVYVNQTSDSQSTVELNGMARGIYVVSVSVSGQRFVRKLIIQ